MKDEKDLGNQRPQQPSDPESRAWNNLPWHTLAHKVLRIQRRIYRACQHRDKETVHQLQQGLMELEAARLLAVHHVTQDNEGKDTAGVDGVKSVPPKGRLALVCAIHPNQWGQQPPKPVRRVWLPKPASTERRPLAILSMLDRCRQALAKMALEPEWEAQFEAHSYGYRPGRGAHDAIAAILFAIDQHPTFVCKADIEGAFDHINQAVLLDKLQTYPVLREAISAWLKAGIIDGNTYIPSETGIAQGGPLSPLLLNVTLHGMETIVKDSDANVHPAVETPLVIRYADDFLVFHSNLEELQQAVSRVRDWLQPMGLSLSARKTRIAHTLSSYQGHVGFDFLGYTIRHYPPDTSEPEQAFACKTAVTPSAEASHHHLAAIEKRLEQLQTASQAQVIAELNPIIGGWAAYYNGFVSVHSLSRYDELVGHLLLNWARKHHPNKERQEVINLYWRPIEEGVWVFSTPDGAELRSHCDMHPREAANPYDDGLGTR